MSDEVSEVGEQLKARLAKGEALASVLRSAEFKSLFEQIKTLPIDQRAAFGQSALPVGRFVESEGSFRRGIMSMKGERVLYNEHGKIDRRRLRPNKAPLFSGSSLGSLMP